MKTLRNRYENSVAELFPPNITTVIYQSEAFHFSVYGLNELY